MIHVEETNELPVELLDDLSEHSRMEWNAAGALGDYMVDHSERILVVRDEWDKPLLSIGLIKPSMISPPEIWALLCQNLYRRPMMWRRLFPAWRKVAEGYPVVRTLIDETHMDERRFIEFFKFKAVGTLSTGFVVYEASI